MNVTTHRGKVGASRPVASRRLSCLCMSGVLATRREGTSFLHRVARPEVVKPLECIRRMDGRRHGRREAR